MGDVAGEECGVLAEFCVSEKAEIKLARCGMGGELTFKVGDVAAGSEPGCNEVMQISGLGVELLIKLGELSWQQYQLGAVSRGGPDTL